MKELIAPGERYGMNWVAGKTEWGTVKAPASIRAEVQTSCVEGVIEERYIFTNISDVPVFTSRKDIAVYTPFNDDYCGAEECVVRRCHTHIFCGGEVAYVCALRMGGEGPHMGLVLTQGSLAGYSVERDTAQMSNDRGDFMLHPSPAALEPGESFCVAWKLFWHNGKEDFYDRLPRLAPHYIKVEATQYVVFCGETVQLRITSAFAFDEAGTLIRRDEKVLPFCTEGGSITVTEQAQAPGEQLYEIEVCGHKTFCRIMVMPQAQELAKKRCGFIAHRQQFHKEGSALDGAFLIYDRQEKHLFYSAENDYNGGRERVGMGVLLARYLQKKREPFLEESLKKYVQYVEREIFDAGRGLVCNDIRHNDSYKRLYNYPWMCVLYLELFDLYGQPSLLDKAYSIMESFYRQGGDSFYAIEVPLERIMLTLKKEGRQEEYEKLLRCFERHCGNILKNGVFYPPHEVNFEQSIVAPAAELLLQMYLVTGEEKYCEGAQKQLALLELFQLAIPDYHQHEVAIRHWDGYWFGKNRLYGDTYPHYWSALSANAYLDYARLLEKKYPDGEYAGQISRYRQLAESTARGVLPLFFADGQASCAYVFPVTVNGQEADRFDLYANDQDWGLYFYIRGQQ